MTPDGWKVVRLFSRLEARVFRPELVALRADAAALRPELTRALAAVDRQLDALLDDVVPPATAA